MSKHSYEARRMPESSTFARIGFGDDALPPVRGTFVETDCAGERSKRELPAIGTLEGKSKADSAGDLNDDVIAGGETVYRTRQSRAEPSTVFTAVREMGDRERGGGGS